MSVAFDMRASDASPQAPTRAGSGGGLGFKVLYALDSFPQLSESYINAEIERMLGWGADIEVWSKDDPKSEGRPVDVKIHRGALVDTIARVKPDIVHTHWTQTALKYKDAAKRNGVPMTARGHWHFVPKQLERIENEETIVRLFMFPHLAAKYGSVSSKIQPMHSCFHHEWLAPARPKNRRMIVRTAACKKPKGLHDFIRIASKLPDYRAVLILCSLGPNALYRELEEFNRSLGSPVEMLHDITYEEVASYLAETGIYLHTYDPEISFGMPVSIAESMAAGCTVIARDVEGASDYAGEAGRYYKSEEEAVALVRETEGWSDAQWAEAERRSRERAFAQFDDRTVLLPLFDCWKEIAAQAQASAAPNVSLMTRFKRWTGLGYKRI